MSLTTGERQALTWLLAVIGVGGGARLFAYRDEARASTPAASEALRRQLVAVDSAQRAEPHRGRSSRSGPERRRPTARSATSDTSDGRSTAPSPRHLPTLTPVDVDVADSAALERLPRIGPSLAARIVADREQRGPFGSVEALQRVRGIGPKLSARLAALVTFSGTPRPSAVQR